MVADKLTGAEWAKDHERRCSIVFENQRIVKYQKAAQAYLKESARYVNWAYDPRPYFSLVDDKLYFHCRFPYGNGYSRLLSPQTIPSFLRNQLQLEEQRTPECDQLQSEGRRTSKCDRLRLEGRRTPERDEFFASLRACIAYSQANPYSSFFKPPSDPEMQYVITPEKNFYTGSYFSSLFSFLPLLSPWDDLPPKNLHSSLKKHFSKIIRSPNPNRVVIPEPHFENSVLYRSDYGKFYQVSYSAETGYFSCTKQDPLSFGAKFVDYHNGDCPLPPTVVQWFSSLTGQSTDLADQLFRLFARIMNSAPGATIIHTKLNQASLIRFFQTLYRTALCQLYFQPDDKSPSPLPSLNQICRNSYLRQLYWLQAHGASFVLLRDLFPADSKYATVRALVSGKPVTLRSTWLPNQFFRNRMHLVILSTDKHRAEYLRRPLNATLIDLAGHESDCFTVPTLSWSDRMWLLQKGILYGLKLNQGYQPPKHRQVPSVVESFLTKQCLILSHSYCNSFTLYEAYVNYYRNLHDGEYPPLSKGQFTKEVRELLGRGKLEGVEYKKCRRPADPLPRWYFAGIDCPAQRTPPPPPPLIQSHLQHIHDSVELPNIPGFPIPRIQGGSSPRLDS